MAKMIKVTLTKSVIGASPKQRKVVEALGLKKIRSFNVFDPNPAILGMIDKVKYLVKVENV